MKLDDTIVMDSVQSAELESSKLTKSGSRLAQIISLVVMVITGTLVGVLSALTLAVSNMVNLSDFPIAERAELAEHYIWAAEFTSDTAQEDFITKYIIIIGILVIAFLIALVVCCINNTRLARSEDGSYKLNWWDRVWSEVQIFSFIIVCGLAIAAAAPIVEVAVQSNWISIMKPYNLDSYVYGIKNEALAGLCTAGMAACILIAAICFVTLVRKIATKSLIEYSLIGKILVLLGVGAKYAGQGATAAGRGLAGATKKARIDFAERNRNLWVPTDEERHAAIKLSAKYILIFGALITVPWFITTFFFYQRGIGTLLIWLVAVILASILIVRKVTKFAEIRAGVIEAKSGNLAYKINFVEDANGPKTDLDKLASDINHISDATMIAVQNEVKSQRLKTDLISNVSHDLKTPLTSMISYLDILEKEGLDSPDAPEHLAIVQEKTERLKTLTEELFEAAKASSGNIPCEITNIDLNALIDQSLAEMGDRLDKKELKVKKNIKAEKTLVRADGKLLYRVLENLLGNISKYALEGSRVYIDVTKPAEYANKLLLEVKNISKEELNISADELMERFTRGDSSRNTEGSGLGLAIAKDFTNIMGGEFNLNIDGDMFKASVLLNEA